VALPFPGTTCPHGPLRQSSFGVELHEGRPGSCSRWAAKAGTRVKRRVLRGSHGFFAGWLDRVL